MKKTVRLAVCILAFAVMAAGCDESRQQLYAGQETVIEEFIHSMQTSHPDCRLTRNKGSVRLTVTEGSGDSLNADGLVQFRFAGYVLSREGPAAGKLFAANDRETAERQQWKITDSTAFSVATLDLARDHPIEGLRNGLRGIRQGEECFILFSTRHGFGKDAMPGIPSDSGLLYQIWAETVKN